MSLDQRTGLNVYSTDDDFCEIARGVFVLDFAPRLLSSVSVGNFAKTVEFGVLLTRF